MADTFKARVKISDAQAFNAKLREYSKLSRISMYEALLHQARNFAIQATREAMKIAPDKESLRNFLFALARRGGLKVKKASRTARQEISRRLAAVGSIAKGFSVARKHLKSSKALNSTTAADWRTGAVEIRLEGQRPYISATNKMAGILAAEQKHNIVSRSVQRTIADIDVYCQRKLTEAKQKAGA